MSNPRSLPQSILDVMPAETVDYAYFVRMDFSGGSERFTDRPEGWTGDIDGSSQFWNADHGLIVGPLAQSTESPTIVNAVSFSNIDGYFRDKATAGILAGTPIHIWLGWFDATGAFIDAIYLMGGEYDAAQLDNRAQISIAPPQSLWAQTLPRPIYSPTCPFTYKDSSTCKYAGGLSACRHDLADCIAHGNELNFGGDPLTPKVGSVLAWGEVSRVMPGADQLTNK